VTLIFAVSIMMYSSSFVITTLDRFFSLQRKNTKVQLRKSLKLHLDVMDSQISLLRVSGTDIVDGNGKRIILKGVSQDVD
jgi:hypothetical protein